MYVKMYRNKNSLRIHNYTVNNIFTEEITMHAISLPFRLIALQRL